MRQTIVLCMIFALAFSKSPIDSESNLMVPVTWDDYYGELYQNEVILVGFFESKESSEVADNVLTTLSYMKNTEYFNNKDIPVMACDMSIVPKVKSFYDFESSPRLWIFVKNRAYKFEDFEKLMKASDSENSISQTYDWSLDVYEKLIIELKTIMDVKEALEEHKIITIYIGDNNENYKMWRKWVLYYTKDPIYTVFDKELREQVLNTYDKEMSTLRDEERRDMMAVIWNEDKLSELDPNAFHYMKEFDDHKNMNLFYKFQTQPKLRNKISSGENISLLYRERMPLFLYNYQGDTETSKKNLYELNNAIKIIPKQFIFDIFEHDSRRNIDYKHLMIMSNDHKMINPNSLYIVWLSHGTKPSIMKFEGDFNTQEIVNWAFDFAKKFPFLFGNPKKEKQNLQVKANEEL